MPDETRPCSAARQCICDGFIYPCNMNGSYTAVIDSLQEGQAFQHVAGLWVVAMQFIYLGNHGCIVAMAKNPVQKGPHTAVTMTIGLPAAGALGDALTSGQSRVMCPGSRHAKHTCR